MIRKKSSGYNTFNGPALQLFSEGDLKRIHLASLEILRYTGIKVEDDEALDYFEKAGAYVDKESSIVKIPGYMVEAAIQSVPSSLFLAGKDKKYDIILEDGRIYACPFGLGIYNRDINTGELRPTTKQDIADCSRLVDYLDEYDYLFETMVARDVPEANACIHGFEAHLKNTRKPCLASPQDKRTAEILVEMGAVVAGGMDKLQERPIMMLGGCTISPLVIPDSTVAAILTGAKYNLPVGVLTMAMSGGMAPVTLAGAVVVSNAEILAALTLSQLARKGTPFLYGTSTGTLDMRTNASASVGCPELGLISAAITFLARMYNMPVFTAGA